MLGQTLVGEAGLGNKVDCLIFSSLTSELSAAPTVTEGPVQTPTT